MKSDEPSVEATERELIDLWTPKLKEFQLPNGKIVWIRALNVEERARCEKLEAPTGHDALTVAVAMGCRRGDGNPLFGPYGEALEKVRKLDPNHLMELGNAILVLSGMRADSTAVAEKN